MTPEEQIIAIAKALPNVIQQRGTSSWFYFDGDGWVQCKDNDPLLDLNAMNEAEKTLGRDQSVRDYEAELIAVMNSGNRVCDFSQYPSDFIWHATAAQRLEAFLKVKGLWHD